MAGTCADYPAFGLLDIRIQTYKSACFLMRLQKSVTNEISGSRAYRPVLSQGSGRLFSRRPLAVTVTTNAAWACPDLILGVRQVRTARGRHLLLTGCLCDVYHPVADPPFRGCFLSFLLVSVWKFPRTWTLNPPFEEFWPRTLPLKNS